MVFEVTATHRVRATGVAACEIYPDVFVIEGRCGVYSRLAGTAAQLPGDFVTALPEGPIPPTERRRTPCGRLRPTDRRPYGSLSLSRPLPQRCPVAMPR